MKEVRFIMNNNKTAVLFDKGSGTGEITLSEMAREFLVKSQLTYGEFVDTYDVLAEFGIVETKGLLRNARKYVQYMNLAKKLGDEMVKHLTLIGFKADKKKKPSYEGFDSSRHINGNVVYTNHMWTVANKAKAAVKESVNSMRGIHDDGIDLSLWEKYSHEQVGVWHSVSNKKRKFGDEDMMEWKTNEFDPEMNALLDDIRENYDEMVAFEKGKQPEGYRRYCNENP